MTAAAGIGVACQSLAVVLYIVGAMNLFRTIVLDLRAALRAGEGATFTRIAAITLGAATALWLSGAVLLRGC
jgi:uncharacterized membrane protein YuzA (DUF378 family)